MVIGVDLGGTKVAAGSLHGRELSALVVAPTERSGSAALLDQLVALVEKLRCRQLDGAGIGVPSVVEFDTARVVASVNVPLADEPLRRVLEERLGVPVFVDNDATVAALAEAHDDELSMVSHNLVMLTVGTGVGGGLILAVASTGARRAGPESCHTLIGANLVDAVPAPVTFPQPGSLERLAAGHALDRLAASVAAADSGSALGRRRAEGKARAWPRCGPVGTRRRRSGRTHNRVMGRAAWHRRRERDQHVRSQRGRHRRRHSQRGRPAPRASSADGARLRRARSRQKHKIRLAWHGDQAGVLGAALLAEHEPKHFRLPRNTCR